MMFCIALLSAAPASAAGLAGSEWRPVSIGAASWPADSEAFVRFEGEGRLAGYSGCNRFMGSYTLAGDSIAIAPLAATRMMCPEPMMERERLLLEVLERARSVTRERTELTLADPEGNVTARFVQTDWD
jgi:heat shock protein HslJ